MSEASDILARLADIHEPAAPEQGVPWLILLNLVLALVWILLLSWRRWRRREAWRREAIAIVDAMHGRSPDEALSALATLLRRVARRRLGERVARLDGEAWLAALDECFATDWFGRREGRAFGHDIYKPGTADAVDVDALRRHVRRLVRRLPSRPAPPAATAAPPRTAPAR